MGLDLPLKQVIGQVRVRGTEEQPAFPVRRPHRHHRKQGEPGLQGFEGRKGTAGRQPRESGVRCWEYFCRIW